MQKFHPYRFIFISLFSFFAWFGTSGQSLTISIDAPNSNAICKGQQITFTATLNNVTLPSCGSTPTQANVQQYFWFINGNSAPSSGNKLTISTLNQGDVVSCKFSHTLVCWSPGQGNPVTTSTDYNSLNSITITTKQGVGLGDIINITSPTANSLVTNKLNTFRTQGLLSDYPSSSFPFTLSWSVPTNLGTVQGSTSSYKVDIELSKLATNGTITLNTNHNDCPAAQYPLGVVTKTINITTYNTPPTVPANVTAIQAIFPSQTVALAWGASTDNLGVDKYKISYTKAGSTDPPGIKSVNAPAVSLSLATTDLKGDGYYTVAVSAIDEDGAESSSISTTFTYDITPPSAPINLSLISRTSRKTFFSWNNGGDNVATTAYDIYVNNVLVGADITSTTYSLTNPVLPTNETFFTISIKAKDAKGNISQAAGLQVDKVPPINIDDATGYVGIGVVPPTERLHVAGNLKIEDGTLLFKGTPPLGTHIKAEVGDLKIGSNINLTALAANTPNRITYNGSSLEFFTPVQAQWNGNKPVLTLSQYGEIEFNSSPVLNYNTLLLKGKNDYNNGLRFGNSFGGTTGFDGPMLYGNNGGILGTNNTNNNNAGSNVALKWDATGRVGIGVTGALTEKLEVNGSVKVTGNQVVSGNIGIGTTGALTEKLEVNGSVVSKNLKLQNTIPTLSFVPTAATGNTFFHIRQNGVGDGQLEFSHGSTAGAVELLKILPTGNVIIPDVRAAGVPLLTIGDDVYFTDIDVAGVVGLYGSTSTEISGIKLGVTGPTLYGNNNGNLGIGTSNPTEKLEVIGNAKITGNLYASGNVLTLGDGGSGESIVRNVPEFSISFKTGFSEKMKLANNGNLGIGITSPSAKLHVVGDTKITGALLVGAAPPTGTNYKLGVDGNARIKGVVAAYELVANANATPDFVFEKDYTLPSLQETKEYVKTNKHLPYIKSAKELEVSGINMTEHTNGMLRHIEEMYLHIIKLEEKIKALETKR